jgi:hypothetical protein
MSFKVADNKPKKRKKINPKEIREKRNKQQSLADRMEEELEKKEVKFFNPSETNGGLNIDTEYLSLPSDVTGVPSQELGKYMNAFTQQRMYMRTLVGWQEMIIEERKREYYDVSNDKYQELTDNRRKLTETAKEKIVNNDPEIKPLFIAFKDAKKKLRLLELNIDSIDDAVFNISREISRREGDFKKENRNESVQRR